MSTPFIFTLFEGLPRQGPGSDACTNYMFDLLSPPANARVLDIGCGVGMQTLAIARRCQRCRITALDVHQPFLDDLTQRAWEAGAGDRITTCRASMDDLPFPLESFDLIWSEGSVFIMGFEKGLRYWRDFLKPDGSLALSEMVWFSDTPSPEVAAFMLEEYPPMTTVRECERIIRDAGYGIIGSFRLPVDAWWNEFYEPLEAKMNSIGDQFADNPDAMAVLTMTRKEVALFRKYSDEYGYQVFLLRKPG